MSAFLNHELHQEKEKVKALTELNEALKSVLRQIINDLPQNRDWLDPNLERQAKELIK